jgi:hypothetical protein
MAGAKYELKTCCIYNMQDLPITRLCGTRDIFVSKDLVDVIIF